MLPIISSPAQSLTELKERERSKPFLGIYLQPFHLCEILGYWISYDASIFLLIDRKHDDLAIPHSDLVWLARDPLREDSDGWLDVALIS